MRDEWSAARCSREVTGNRARIAAVLEQNEGAEVSEGTIEDDEDDDNGVKAPKPLSDLERHWIKICRAAVVIPGCVDGFAWTEATREWPVEGKLAQKAQQCKEEDRVEKLE